MIRKIYAMSIVVLMLSVVMLGSVSAFISDIDDELIDDEYKDSIVPDGSYEWSYPDNPIIWIGAGLTNLASDPDNWDLGIVPTSEHDVIFDGTSVKNCTWDLDASIVTVNSLTLANGYTGTLTQGDVDIGIGAGGYLQEAGIFTANVNKVIFQAGPFNIVGGTLTIYRLNLFAINDITIDGTVALKSIETTDDVVINVNGVIYAHNIINGHGAVMNVSNLLRLNSYTASSMTLLNRGIIQGKGELHIVFDGSYPTTSIEYGNIFCSTTIRSAGANLLNDVIVKLNNNVSFGNTFNIFSSDSTTANTILDLNGFSLNANGITVGEMGAIVGDGKIINAGDLDASAGMIDISGHYVQAGDGNITMQDGSYIDRLTVLPKASLHLGSDLYLGRLPNHHYNILSSDGYGYWIDDTFYTVPIWESASDDEKPYIAIIFLVLVLVISIIGYHYRIVLLQLVSLLCLAYGISRYISHPVVEWYPIYLILTLAGIVMIIYSIIRR